MMYSQKFVVVVKSSGRVLRENKDIVFVKFGSEYSLLLKNLNSVRAEVDVSIDGTCITPYRLVLNAGQEIDLKRSLANGNLSVGNALKFIERTSKIEKHRGVGSEDGLVRVAFKFEKVLAKPVWVIPNYIQGHWEWNTGYPRWSQPSWITTNAVETGTNQLNIGNATAGVQSAMRGVAQNAVFTTSASLTATPENDVGITVPGSESNQKFQTVSSFATEDEEHVMILRLLGETEGGKTVKEPVTVKAKARCVTCGRNNKATASFCQDCGTSLSII